ncbi:MAG: ABC transporter substrate-binding protein [Candidatus Caldarchaeum sp.]|nr:ABC transporter substrate-binding protein [Candidatus Caldarchaeum sp.]MDW7977677.1 ABC transporter substrate-binding protein [Candidatus Caldarchaeum sp.]
MNRRGFLKSVSAAALSVSALSYLDRFALAQAESLYGGTFIMALASDPATMTPNLSTGWVPQQCGWPVYSSLINLDPALNPKPNLAESWTVSDDFKRFVFQLRRNVRWHDGKPFTAADVVFTFEEVNKKLSPFSATYRSFGLTATALDNYTVEIKFDKPFPSFLTYIDLPYYGGAILPKHLWEGTDISRNPYNFRPVGTGPFVFKEYVSGNYIMYERNNNYFKTGLPYLEKFILKIIPDYEGRILALERGEVDAIIGVDLLSKDYDRLRRNTNLTLSFGYDRAIGGIRHVFFNMRPGRPTANLKVREALTMAVDKQQINRLITLGEGTVINGPVAPDVPYFTSDVPVLPYDPQRAEALLEEAGFRKGPDGVRLTLSLVTSTIPSEGRKIGELLTEMYARIGVRLNVEFLEVPAWRTKRDAGDWDLMPFQALTGPDPAFTLVEQYSKTAFRPVGFNISAYANDQVEELFTRSQVETNPANKKDLVAQLQRKIVEDRVAIWLYHIPQPNAVSRKFRDFNNGPWGHQNLEGVWWIEGKPAGRETVLTTITAPVTITAPTTIVSPTVQTRVVTQVVERTATVERPAPLDNTIILVAGGVTVAAAAMAYLVYRRRKTS